MLESIGVSMRGKLDRYISDRSGLEQQWLKNLRQYRGKYDPEEEKKIPDDRSKVYPRDTRIKVKAFVAKMMEMMFPASEYNWELETTPIPSVMASDLDTIIAALMEAEMMKAEQEQRPPTALTSKDIEKAVKAFADIRKDNMERKIRDQLADPDTDFPQLCKRVIRSGAIYGAGFLKSPMVRSRTERVWEEVKGKWQAKKVTEKRPYPEFVKVWDIYPDLSAWTWEEQEGLFERMVFTRHNLRMLGKRPGFRTEAINSYLRDHQIGNYVRRTFEAGLDQMNYNTAVADRDARKYEVFRWYGYMSAHQLSQVGFEIDETDMDKDLLVDLWMIDNDVIKIDLAPFGERPSDMYHAFIYTEDEDSGLTGVGMPEELRDSQISLCASTRAMFDNMAATAGPMLEVAVDLLKRGSDHKSIHSFKVFEREGEGPDLAYPAVRAISHPSHINDIQSIIRQTREQFDAESSMPSWMTGNTANLGEAFRTSRNMSMMTGGGNIIPKDNVRSFDRFTTSVVGSFLRWNQEFLDDPDIMGDFGVRPKGNISLVAKEVRGAALDQMLSQMTPEERAIIKTRQALIERFKARDLDLSIIMDQDEADAALASVREAQASATQAQADNVTADTQRLAAQAQKLTADAEKTATQASLIEAQVVEVLSRVDAMEKTTKREDAKQQLGSIKEMLGLILTDTAGGGENV
jgi:hypothetical protein